MVSSCCWCRDLDRPVDWDVIRRLGKRAVLVAAPDDLWYPMHHYFDTQKAVPGIEVRSPSAARLRLWAHAYRLWYCSSLQQDCPVLQLTQPYAPCRHVLGQAGSLNMTQQLLCGVQEYYSAELTHAFCCHTKQCQLVAQLVHLSVKKALHPEDITAQDQQLEVSNAAADVSVLLSDSDDATPRKDVDSPPAKPQASGSKQLGRESQLRQRQAQQPAGVTA